MDDPRRQDRAAPLVVRRVWRAVPYRKRCEVVRYAKRGERHPDADAVAAGVAYAEMCLRSRTLAPLQRFALIVGVLLLVESLLLRDWIGIVLAVVASGWDS